MMHITRRLFALSGAALLALSGTAAMAQATIKVGLLTIDSGPFATYANLIEEGAKTGIDLLNAEGGALGRKFELVIQAHSGSPAAALAAATKLAQQGGVSVIMGQTLSSHSLALSPKLDALNVLHIDTYAQSNDLMTKSCAPNYFRVNTPDALTTRMMQDYVKSTGAKTWNLISMDYAAGQSFAKGFSDLVTGMGGTVQQNLFSPPSTTDFGSFISQLSKPADALVVTLFMSDGQSFAKQSKQFGLFEKYKTVIGNGFATDFQLEAHGDNVLGVVNSLELDAGVSRRAQCALRERVRAAQQAQTLLHRRGPDGRPRSVPRRRDQGQVERARRGAQGARRPEDPDDLRHARNARRRSPPDPPARHGAGRQRRGRQEPLRDEGAEDGPGHLPAAEPRMQGVVVAP